MRAHWMRKVVGKAARTLPWMLVTLGLATFSFTAQAADAPTVRFGVPAWPGVTVQSQVAADILDAMGYDTKQVTSSPAFILKSIASGDLDVYLGGWVPTESGMIDPLVKAGTAVVLTTNVSGAIAGLAVPAYVWDAGVHSEADLAKFGDKFDHKIYGIEVGSGFNQAVLEAIKHDRNGLGDWKLVGSSTSGMLAAVGNAIKHHKWIVFDGWKPHSMNIRWNIKYLHATGHSEIAEIKSDVLTVANPDMVKQLPDVARFLRQFKITNKTMSDWIYQFAYKDGDPKDIATAWIKANPDVVATWLKGVKARDGKPAADAIKAEAHD